MKKNTFFTILLCLLTLPLLAQDAIRSEWMKGYVKMESADKAADNPTQALPLYQEALAIFQSVQRKAPQWNSALINYRIDYCRKAIEKLNASAQIEAEAMNIKELKAANERQAVIIIRLTEEKAALNTRVDVLTESLNRAREEAAKAAGLEASAQNAAAQLKTLEDKLRRATLELSDKDNEIQRLKAQGDSTKALQELQTKIAQKDRELRQARTEQGVMAETLRKTQQQLQDLQARLGNMKKAENEAAAALKDARETIALNNTDQKHLQEKIDSLQKRLQEQEAMIKKRDLAMEKLLKIKQETGDEQEMQKVLDLLIHSEQARAKLLAMQEELLATKALCEKQRLQLAAAADEKIRLASQITSATQASLERSKQEKLLQKQLDDVTSQYNDLKISSRKLQQQLDVQLDLTRRQEQELANMKKREQELAELQKTASQQELQHPLPTPPVPVIAPTPIASTQTKPDAELTKRCQELTEKLEQETKRRRALEAALVDRRTPSATPHTPEVKTPAPAIDSDLQRQQAENKAAVRNFLQQGIEAEQQKKTEAAQWNYQKVLEIDKTNTLALQRLGLIASNQGNDQDTIRYLQQAFRQDPDDKDTLFALGYALIRQNEPDWAIANLARAVALNPKSHAIRKTYGMALAALGWRQPAETQLQKAYELNTKDPEAPFSLAVLLASAQPPRLQEAKTWYEIALKNGSLNDPGLDAVLR